MSIELLIGKTITDVTGLSSGSDEVIFTTSDGSRFRMWHSQDCCESVGIDDVCGDASDIIGSQVTVAEEVSGETAQPDGWTPDEYEESYTWTFYKIDTAKGGVTIRWFGSSNGYYSESVDFEQVN